MTNLRARRPRVRLDRGSYRKLCQRILERDGWRCQRCGCPGELHVHHINPRSRLGDDIEQNLITLNLLILCSWREACRPSKEFFNTLGCFLPGIHSAGLESSFSWSIPLGVDTAGIDVARELENRSD